MSIVAVHGPNTFGSRGVQESGPLMSFVNPTNGLKWDFNLDQTTTRSDQDFAWTFPPDGTPTPQNVANPTEVTYAAVGTGTKTAQCVVTNTAKATITNRALTNNVATLTFSAPHGFAVGQVVTITGGTLAAPFLGTFTLTAAAGTTVSYALVNADVTTGAATGTATSASTQYPTAGTYTVDVPVASGGGGVNLLMAPAMAPADSGGGGGGEESSPDVEVGYDPAAHTVEEVKQFVTDHPDEVQAIYDAEVAGKNRTSLISWLEENTPFDPGDHTVAEVEEFVADNPETAQDMLDAEVAGRNRVTLVEWLEDFLTSADE